jgi:hypothetical protein
MYIPHHTFPTTHSPQMDHDNLSAMALELPAMVKNRILSMHASRVFSEVKKLNLATVQEREAEYTRRMMELPNHVLYPQTNEPQANEPQANETQANEPAKVRYTFSMPKKGAASACQYRASGASSASSASSV